MARRTRKTKSKDYSTLKWYAAFGFSALLIAAGVFWMFSIMYDYNLNKLNVMATQMNTATMYDLYNQSYAAPSFEPEFPVLAYVAIALVVLGAAGFLASKFFYEKSKE